MSVDLCVVVVTYNSEDVVEGLLDSLPAALGDAAATVVVVDNGSTDGTVRVLSARQDCNLVRAENRGYAAGLNRGVEHGPAGVPVLVLNPDLRLHEGAVPALLAALTVPGTGVTAPRVLDGRGRLVRSLRREPTVLRAIGLNATGWSLFAEYVVRERDYDTPRTAAWALGAALLMSRECYDAVGGWDESYFLYSEETDFCLRAGDLGFSTRYEPGAVATHVGGGSGQDDRTHTMQIVNRVRLYRRRHGLIPSWAYFGVTVLSELTWWARGHPQSRSAVVGLLLPRRRPAVLCAPRLLPT